jgi:hypothetical protein
MCHNLHGTLISRKNPENYGRTFNSIYLNSPWKEYAMKTYLPLLTDRAQLAIHCLTEHCDKSRGYIPYFYTRMSDRPVSAVLSIWSYGDGLGRSVDALTLLRAMTGDHIDHPADRSLRATLIGLLGEDGLSWCPAEPWTMDVPHTRPAWLQQGTLLALTSLYQFTGDQEYLRLAERNILAVQSMAVQHPEGYSDFPGDVYTRREGWNAPSTDPMHAFSVFSTSVTMPLMRFFKLTGYEPALKLASNLIAWALRDHAGGEKLFDIGHFHCQSRLVTAILLRGAVSGSKEDLQMGERLYLKARALGTSTGWFPEQINNPEHHRSELSETCCLTDMLESAILLAKYVQPSYWNDVQRYANNHLLAHQIVDTEWFQQMTPVPREKHVIGYNYENLQASDGNVESDRFRDTLKGGFAGWGAVSAMSDDTMFSNTNQHCCNAAGARALYDAWHYALEEEKNCLNVNLHISRRHTAADMELCHNDNNATLTLKIHKKCSLRIRIPENVSPEEIDPNDGMDILSRIEGEYLIFEESSQGDVIAIKYPLHQRITKEKTAAGDFTFHWKGDTVCQAEPIQAIRPLFENNRFADEVNEQPLATIEMDSL